MNIEVQPLIPRAPTGEPAATPTRRSRREERWARRRRRMWFEEVMGWILVPLIVLACYWLVETVLNGLGTSISAVFSGIRELASAF